MTRLRAIALVGLLVLVAGCNVNTRVDITMHDDGSGVLRTTITVDSDGVAKMGGAASLARTVPLDDLRSAGWTISPWKSADAGAETITLSHFFANEAELSRRVVDLAGPHGILQNPTLRHQRGWFSSHDEMSVVVDVRSPTLDIVSDAALAARLRAAGVDPALLQAQLAVQLKTALHLSVVIHLPGGHTHSFEAATGSVKTVRASNGGTDWDRVVKLGIGLALALLAALFFLAAGVGVRRNRRRAAQRVARGAGPDRAPLM